MVKENTMTHKELLTKVENQTIHIANKVKPVSDDCEKEIGGFANALRAVVELHKPSRIDKDMTYCEGCSNSAFFPWASCPTIEAIIKGMNS